MKPSVAVVVLAAGESRRLGRPKQTLLFRGRTLLAHAVATARATDCGPVLVVLGCGIDDLRDNLAGPGLRIVENADWALGMGTSVRAAVAVVEAEMPGAGAVLITVCDQPLVTAELLTEMVHAYRKGHPLVAAAYAGTIGVPALFARPFFGELQALPADAGARKLLARHASAVFALPFPDGAMDIDTPEDAATLTAPSSVARGAGPDRPAAAVYRSTCNQEKTP